MPLGSFPGRPTEEIDGEPEDRPEDIDSAVPRGVGLASEYVRLFSLHLA